MKESPYNWVVFPSPKKTLNNQGELVAAIDENYGSFLVLPHDGLKNNPYFFIPLDLHVNDAWKEGSKDILLNAGLMVIYQGTIR